MSRVLLEALPEVLPDGHLMYHVPGYSFVKWQSDDGCATRFGLVADETCCGRTPDETTTPEND